MRRLLIYLAWDLPAFVLGFGLGYLAADLHDCYGMGYHGTLSIRLEKICERNSDGP